MRFSTFVACASAALVAAPLSAFAQDQFGGVCGTDTCGVAERCCTDKCVEPSAQCCETVAEGFCAASEKCCGPNCCAADQDCCGSVCCPSGQICGAGDTCVVPTCTNTLVKGCRVDESTITCKKGDFPPPEGISGSGVPKFTEQCTSGDNVNTCASGNGFTNYQNCARGSSSEDALTSGTDAPTATESPAAPTGTEAPFGTDFPFGSSGTPAASDVSKNAAAPTESPAGSDAPTATETPVKGSKAPAATEKPVEGSKAPATTTGSAPSSTAADASSSAAAAGTSAAPTTSAANAVTPFIGTVVASAIVILASVC